MAKKATKYVYDPVCLIELVEQRPCIWDKTVDDYKDRIKKTKAWTEVHQYLIEDFENLPEEEKVEAGKTFIIISKVRNKKEKARFFLFYFDIY